MADEQKIIFRQETFNDVAVHELARSKAKCICMVQFGRCTKEQCNSCSVHREFMNCYNAMNDYDRQRLKNYTAEEYAQASLNPDNFSSYKNLKKRYLSLLWCFILIVVVITGFIIFMSPGDMPESWGKSNRDYIPDAILTTQKWVTENSWDINNDGQVNCVDRTVLWKLYWDKHYPSVAYNCEIVRNLNPATGMHHVFIQVTDIYNGFKKIEIEPWAPEPTEYLMSENWITKYNPKCNIYGETKKWLKEYIVKRQLE